MQIDEIRLKQIQSDISHNAALKNNGIRLAGSSSYVSGASFEGVATDFGAKTIRRENPNYNKNDLTEDFFNLVGNDDINSESDVSLKNKMLSAVKGISTDDIKNADESGVDLKKKNPKELTTVTDQIKEKFVKAGIDISDMGGLSKSKMEALSGGDKVALSELKNAMEKASEIKNLSNDSALYLVKNNLTPTIENVYKAEFSAASKNTENLEIDDETKKILDSLKNQLSNIFYDAGLEASEENIKTAGLFLQNDIPLTAENFKSFSEIANGKFKDTPEKMDKAILDSVKEGKMPEEAFVLDGFSNSEKAKNAVQVINNADDNTVKNLVKAGKNLTISNLALFESDVNPEIAGSEGEMSSGENIIKSDTNGQPSLEGKTEVNSVVRYELTIVSYQRTVSEAQLMMTQNAAYSLIKQGFDIDTTDLSKLVSALKEREDSLYRALLGEDTPNVNTDSLESLKTLNGSASMNYTEFGFSYEERVEIFESTNQKVNDFTDYPVSILGSRSFSSTKLRSTFYSLHDLGANTKAAYEKAGEEYETFGTEIRKDLGDSIKKAFRNVPDILKDLGLEDTDSNEQAVRILSYNSSEITKESVLSMKYTSEKVSRTISNMKPGVVAEMVREGINPLDLSIDDLYEKTEEIKASSGTDSSEENFGTFLYQAEKSQDISDEEREGFIGIARLCYQVEKTDGAVIGQLLKQGVDITLRNMMTAVRSKKHEGIEYEINDDFNGVNAVNTENNITMQIEKAFETMRMKDASDLMTVEKMKAFGEEENYLKLSPDEFATSLEKVTKTKNDLLTSKEENTDSENRDVLENFDIDNESALEEDYFSSEKMGFENAANAEKKVYEALSNFDMPVTIENLESLNYLMTKRNEMYRDLFNNNHKRNVFSETTIDSAEKTISDVMEDLTNEFGEAVKTPESMAEAEEALYDLAEHALDDAIVDEKNGSVDVKAMRLKANAMKFSVNLGKENETFALPIKIADSNGNMVLKIVRGRKEERGAFELSLFSEALGHVNASFKYSEGEILGTVSADSENTKELLESKSDELIEKMTEISESHVSISYSWSETIDANFVFNDNSKNYDFEIEPAGEKDKSEIQTAKLYLMAKAFIESLS